LNNNVLIKDVIIGTDIILLENQLLNGNKDIVINISAKILLMLNMTLIVKEIEQTCSKMMM